MSRLEKALATREVAKANVDTDMEIARILAASELLPTQYRGKPQNVIIAMQHAEQLKLPPAVVMQHTHNIHGSPTSSANFVSALVRKAGHRLRVRGDEKIATAKIVRRDDPEFEFVSTWTIERAEKAGFPAKNPNWKTQPAAMLRARAITEVARQACYEDIIGLGYTAEELDGPLEVVAEQMATPDLTITQDGEVIEGEIVSDED